MVGSTAGMVERAGKSTGPALLHVVIRLVIGLVLGLLCAAAGLLVVGMGHGWGLPLRFGFLSLLLYPLAMLRCCTLTGGTPWRRDVAVTAPFAVLVVLAASYIDALPPPPRGEALEWLMLFGVPVAYGLAGWGLERWRLHVAFADAVLLVVGILLDLAAWNAFNGDRDGAGLVRLYPELVAPWLVLWLGWQAVAVLALIRHLHHRTRPAP